MRVVNVPFSEEESRIIKAESAAVGLSQQQWVHGMVVFARLAVWAFLRDGKGRKVKLTSLISLLVGTTPEVAEAWAEVYRFVTRLQEVEVYVESVANAQDGDFEQLRDQAQVLRNDGPFTARSLS